MGKHGGQVPSHTYTAKLWSDAPRVRVPMSGIHMPLGGFLPLIWNTVWTFDISESGSEDRTSSWEGKTGIPPRGNPLSRPQFTRTVTYLVGRTHLLPCEPGPLLGSRKAAVRSHDRKPSGFHWNCRTSAWAPCTRRCLLRSWCAASPSLACSWSGSSKACVLSHPCLIPSGCTSVLLATSHAQGSNLIGLPGMTKHLHDVIIISI